VRSKNCAHCCFHKQWLNFSSGLCKLRVPLSAQCTMTQCTIPLPGCQTWCSQNSFHSRACAAAAAELQRYLQPCVLRKGRHSSLNQNAVQMHGTVSKPLPNRCMYCVSTAVNCTQSTSYLIRTVSNVRLKSAYKCSSFTFESSFACTSSITTSL
jgi:hypothetical protein